MSAIRILDVIARQQPYGGSTSYYLVIDRSPVRVYERTGNMLVSHDSGFYDFLGIKPGSKGAFGGREFDIKLTDGSTYHCDGQVWACGRPEGVEPTVEVGVSTLEHLRNCYVFCGASVSRALLEQWLAANTPSNRYYKYDRGQSVEALERRWDSGNRPVCAKRARKLRRRGVKVWTDADGRRTWSPSYERRRRELAAELANDPGSMSRALVERLAGVSP